MTLDLKLLRQTTDSLTSLLKLHNFSDTSIQSLVSTLVTHALSPPDPAQTTLDSDFSTGTSRNAETIAVLCNHLKSSVRWHATASRSAAFQMTLSARVNGEFYRDWETTSQNIESSLTFLSSLSVQSVLPIQNLFHATLHVSRHFSTPSHLCSIIGVLGASQVSSRPSEVGWEVLIENVEARLRELGVSVDGPGAGKEEEMYRDVVKRLAAIVRGTTGNAGMENMADRERVTKKMGVASDDVQACGTAHMLETIVKEVVLATDIAEKAQIGKSKAGA